MVTASRFSPCLKVSGEVVSSSSTMGRRERKEHKVCRSSLRLSLLSRCTLLPGSQSQTFHRRVWITAEMKRKWHRFATCWLPSPRLDPPLAVFDSRLLPCCHESPCCDYSRVKTMNSASHRHTDVILPPSSTTASQSKTGQDRQENGGRRMASTFLILLPSFFCQ